MAPCAAALFAFAALLAAGARAACPAACKQTRQLPGGVSTPA
jgi:hypothetical protein